MKPDPQAEPTLDRLSSLDESGRRIAIQPAKVTGEWHTRRVRLQSVLLVILLILPWIRINGMQSILLDVPARRFVLFGVVFWAHDTPLLLLLFAIFAFVIALVTTLWGRAWCGWACPQTVFIERVFRAIETRIEGNHLQRRDLDRSPWNKKKIFFRGSKWLAFAAVSTVLTHSLLAYFTGVDELREMIQANPRENWPTFLFMISVNALVLFNFGWFREQFCVIMCPYGKIQSLFTDRRTLTVTYDYTRGEPRRGKAAAHADCVNCFKCVNVCPTRIDIRNGSQQLECIGCTACIDACDDVMTKIGKPKGLIRYASDAEVALGKPAKPFQGIRHARPIVLAALIVICFSALVWSVFTREELKISALRAGESPYQVVKAADGSEVVINHFKLDVRNQSGEDFAIRLNSTEKTPVKIITGLPEYGVKAGRSERIDVFIEFPAHGEHVATLLVTSVSARKNLVRPVELRLISPDLERSSE